MAVHTKDTAGATGKPGEQRDEKGQPPEKDVELEKVTVPTAQSLNLVIRNIIASSYCSSPGPEAMTEEIPAIPAADRI